MMKIALPLCDHFGGYFAVVSGEIIDVAPHLAHVATFAVHQPHRSSALFKWRVTNVETGYSVGFPSADTRDQSIEAAREALASKTPADIALSYKRARRNGIR